MKYLPPIKVNHKIALIFNYYINIFNKKNIEIIFNSNTFFNAVKIKTIWI